jgi:hypothetical protein
LAAGKLFSSLLSLFYELTSCFYLSFRLTTTLQPKNGMPYAQPAMPPFLDDGVAIRQQHHTGKTLGGLQGIPDTDCLPSMMKTEDDKACAPMSRATTNPANNTTTAASNCLQGG